MAVSGVASLVGPTEESCGRPARLSLLPDLVNPPGCLVSNFFDLLHVRPLRNSIGQKDEDIDHVHQADGHCTPYSRLAEITAGLFSIDEYHALMTGEDERLDDITIPGFDGEDALNLASALSQDEPFRKWLPEMYWFHLGGVNLAATEVPQIEELNRVIEMELSSVVY